MIDACKNVIEALALDSLFDGIGIQKETLVKCSPILDVTEMAITSAVEKTASLRAINLVIFNSFSSFVR